MSFPDIIDLCVDEETEVLGDNSGSLSCSFKAKAIPDFTLHMPEIGENASGESFLLNPSLNGSNGSVASDRLDLSDNGVCSSPAFSGAVPLCRQFWKAGDFESTTVNGPFRHNLQNRLRIHPKFLHSNATSHKWAFGAIAELLDNALDEVQKGASFIIIDKTTNPRDGTPALLMRDNGGGMDPETLRQCMSFGFSNKLESSIGQYGNGFKTSTMRLGADVIVFSRNMSQRTQSVGILSYTFLKQTGCDDVIVPVVDYQFDLLTGKYGRLIFHGEKVFTSNLSVLLKWSPFSTEAELLTQFDNIECHGTKIIVFNLWDNDDGKMELDFESDAEDVMISGAPKPPASKSLSKLQSQKHVANRFRYSLRVYSSILYLHLPAQFMIILRGRAVDPHYIVNDLKFCEGIKYKPQLGDKRAAEITTIIGYLKGSPNVDVHGFNVYHKNRLILPFLPVVATTNGKGKGVVGVLEANFIKPTHNKQDFERSTIYQRLETRLRDMTFEYWDFHCHLVGYENKKVRSIKSSASTAPDPPMLHSVTSSLPAMADIYVLDSSHQLPCPVSCSDDPTEENCHSSTGCEDATVPSALASQPPRHAYKNASFKKRLPEKRNHGSFESANVQLTNNEQLNGLGSYHGAQAVQGVQRRIQEIKMMVQENKKLRAECAEYERTEKELATKEHNLRREVQALKQAYKLLLVDLEAMDCAKAERW